VDKATENYIYDAILRNYPDHRVIGPILHLWRLPYYDHVLLHQLHDDQDNFLVWHHKYRDGKPYAGLVYDVMKDVLYHAKVGEGAFENKHPNALQLLAWFTISEKIGPILGLVIQLGLIPIKLYHAKVGEGAFENKHELKPLNDTHLKQSLIGINPKYMQPIVP
jgi:fructose-1,6-bisphosphatase/inositol monophosphatase family enzyme